jgi:hypothetical protein
MVSIFWDRVDRSMAANPDEVANEPVNQAHESAMEVASFCFVAVRRRAGELGADAAQFESGGTAIQPCLGRGGFS